jgi:hypothetical protein
MSTWLGVSGVTSVLADDRFQSYISDETGQQLVVCNGSSMGLSYSNNAGATWADTSFNGTPTSVYHLGQDAYIFAGERGVFTLGGLYNGASGSFILDKTGNLQDVVTGTFDTMIIRYF